MGDSKEEEGTEDSAPERRILINGNPFFCGGFVSSVREMQILDCQDCEKL